MKACSACSIAKPLTEFHWKSKSKGTRHARCKQCVRTTSKQWYDGQTSTDKTTRVAKIRSNTRRYSDEKFVLLFEHLKGKSCLHCGETNPIALEFDHLKDKFRDIGKMMYSHSWSSIQEEMKKCQILCANCHRKITAERQRSRMYRLVTEGKL